MTNTDQIVDQPMRNAPQQRRAQLTLKKIDDAIRHVLADPQIGRDRFTTAQVAQLAGVSIGTVYRYFTDRTAMLEHMWPDRSDTYLPGD